MPIVRADDGALALIYATRRNAATHPGLRPDPGPSYPSTGRGSRLRGCGCEPPSDAQDEARTSRLSAVASASLMFCSRSTHAGNFGVIPRRPARLCGSANGTRLTIPASSSSPRGTGYRRDRTCQSVLRRFAHLRRSRRTTADDRRARHGRGTAASSTPSARSAKRRQLPGPMVLRILETGRTDHSSLRRCSDHRTRKSRPAYLHHAPRLRLRAREGSRVQGALAIDGSLSSRFASQIYPLAYHVMEATRGVLGRPL